MAAKTSDWRPGPTVCRCCFADGCYKDISTEYFWMGKREVYSEMLLETFDVSIAYAQTSGPNSNSRLICEPCISRLRDASDFKRQVQECEKVFLQHLAEPGSSLEFEILPETSQKEEVKLELERVKIEAKVDNDDDFDDHLGFDDDDDDDMDDEPLTKFASKVPKEESDDLMNILLDDETKKPEKRKSSTKVKLTVKKTKKKESPKPSASKASTKPVAEKKKKGGLVPVQGSSNRQLLIKQEVDSDDERSSKISLTIEKNGQRLGKLLLDKKGIEKTKLKSNQKITFTYKKDKAPPQRKNKTKIITITGKEQKKPSIKCKKLVSNHPFYNANHAYACYILNNSNALPFRYLKGKYLCMYCDTACPAIDQLRGHSTTHDKLTTALKNRIKFPILIEISGLACSICNLPVYSLNSLKEHLEFSHTKKAPSEEDEGGSIVPYIITENDFKCVHCEETFITFGRLLLHSNNHYQNHVCDICGAGFPSQRRLKQHKEIHEENNRGCPKCGLVLPTKAARFRHIVHAHGPKNRYKCPLCDASFQSYYKRLMHLNSEHGQKNEYPCKDKECPLVFATASMQGNHYRRVHLKIKDVKKKKQKNATVTQLPHEHPQQSNDGHGPPPIAGYLPYPLGGLASAVQGVVFAGNAAPHATDSSLSHLLRHPPRV